MRTDNASRLAPAVLAQRGLARGSLVRDLRALGVTAGQILLVHASMRKIGWVGGGAAEVVAALREVLGEDGTLVVPTCTADNSDTSRLHLAQIAGMTRAEIDRHKAAMPPFSLERPSAEMGRIAEHVRRAPGAVRSEHPQTSFAALGHRADALMAGHDPTCHFGESSPMGRLYRARAWFLLLGVDYEACSAFHLAEYRYITSPPRRSYSCVVAGNGGAPEWRSYEDVVLDDGDFAALGTAFDATRHVIRGRVGQADCRLMPLTAAVDFAAEWLRHHRQQAGVHSHPASPETGRSRSAR
jgi:aminoglycoside 3-N-acetyltransferase